MEHLLNRQTGATGGAGGLGVVDRPALCPCQWGLSAYCLHGQHDRCRSDIPTAYPETWVTDAAGRVWGLDYAQVQVWLADRVCRWVCPCDCHATTSPVQLDLLAVV